MDLLHLASVEPCTLFSSAWTLRQWMGRRAGGTGSLSRKRARGLPSWHGLVYTLDGGARYLSRQGTPVEPPE